MELNRRDFLKGAGAVGAVGAMGALGLTACSPSGESAETGNANASTNSETTMTAQELDKATWSFEVPPEPIAESDIAETVTHEVVVVGAGMAGLCCAVSAAESGCDVVVFSASTKPISRGGSNSAIGSKYQKSVGIDDSPQKRMHQMKVEQLAGVLQMDLRKWSKWMMNSGEGMDWMIDKMASKGVKVSLEMAYHDVDGLLENEANSHNFFTDEQPFGVFFGAPIIAQAYADIFTDDFDGEIHYSTIGQYLIRDDDNAGRVSAVIAQREDGSYVKYEATKAVVLATGDFSRNEDMMRRYSPFAYEKFKDTIDFSEVNYDAEMQYTGLMDGAGQRMGLWVGAAWQRVFPNPCAINGGAPGPAHCVIDNFWGINLGSNGRRYQNENTNFAFGAYSKMQLPDQTAFGVWDSAYAYTEDEWHGLGSTVNAENGIGPTSPDDMLASWNASADEGTYYRADTLEELVKQMEGIDQEAALDEIAKYNRYAEQGYDEEYFVNPSLLHPISTPPFFAAKSTGSTFLAAMGGLRTSIDMEVCEEDDTPIKGLYSVGTMIGDFYACGYNFGFPGQNLGACCGTFPYLLGRHLATV